MSALAAGLSTTRSEGRHFYVWMGMGSVLVAFGGLLPTYWAPVVAGWESWRAFERLAG